VPARIDLVTKKNGIFYKFSQPEKLSATFNLILFPKYAGEFTIEYTVPQYGWKFVKTIQDEWPSPDCGESKCNVRHVLKISVPHGNVRKLGNQRIGSISKRCVPNWGPAACGWSYDEGTSISADGTSASFNVRHDGEKVTWTFYGGVEEYSVLGTKTEAKRLNVRYGSNFSTEIPTDATYYKITGTTLTKRKVELAKGQADDKDLLKFVGAFDMPPESTKIEYLCRVPTGL
jgi:rubredoxin